MDEELKIADSHRDFRLLGKMADEKYRHSYIGSHNRQILAKQMRLFRGDATQSEFGAKLGKPQTIVSRLENPNYPGWSLSTIFEVAQKLDVAVFVRFVDFPTFLTYTRDMSDSALRPRSYDQQTLNDFVKAEVSNQKKSALDDYGVISGLNRDPLESGLQPKRFDNPSTDQNGATALLNHGKPIPTGLAA